MKRGMFVWWRSSHGLTIAPIRDVDDVHNRVLIDVRGIRAWVPVALPGLNVLPELTLTIPMPRKNDYA